MFGFSGRLFFQQIFLALAGVDLEFLGLENPGNLIRKKSGGIDHIFCLYLPAVRRRNQKPLSALFRLVHLKVGEESQPVFPGRFDQCKNIAIGFDHPAGRRIKPANHIARQFWLQILDSLRAAEFNVWNIVFLPLGIELFDRFHLLV